MGASISDFLYSFYLFSPFCLHCLLRCPSYWPTFSMFLSCCPQRDPPVKKSFSGKIELFAFSACVPNCYKLLGKTCITLKNRSTIHLLGSDFSCSTICLQSVLLLDLSIADVQASLTYPEHRGQP